ncbi:hypothetical protein HOY80DRAFT_1037782 [Tuber brumale]|nr:hypothetical protein HOY80DRAFT_1037782 [Tuber brumale]
MVRVAPNEGLLLQQLIFLNKDGDIEAWVLANKDKNLLDHLVTSTFFDCEEEVDEEEEEEVPEEVEQKEAEDSAAAIRKTAIFIYNISLMNHGMPGVQPYPVLPPVLSSPVALSIDRMMNRISAAHSGPAPPPVWSLPITQPFNTYDEEPDGPDPTRPRPTTGLTDWHDSNPSQLSLSEKDLSIQDLLPGNPAIAAYLTTTKHLSMCSAAHHCEKDSNPTDNFPTLATYAIRPYSMPTPPCASSQIAGLAAPFPATLFTGSVTLSLVPAIAGLVATSPAHLVDVSDSLSPTITLGWSVTPYPAITIAECVAVAPTTPIAALDSTGSTMPLLPPRAMTRFEVAASILPSPLVAAAGTFPLAQYLPSPPLLSCHLHTNHSRFCACYERRDTSVPGPAPQQPEMALMTLDLPR